MHIWLLFVTIQAPSSGLASFNVEFRSKEECEKAGEAIYKRWDDQFYVSTLCLGKTK